MTRILCSKTMNNWYRKSRIQVSTLRWSIIIWTEPKDANSEPVNYKTVKKSDVHNLYIRAAQEWEVYLVALIALLVAAGFSLLIPYFVGQFVTSTLSLTPTDIRNTVLKLLGVGFGTAFAGLVRSHKNSIIF